MPSTIAAVEGVEPSAPTLDHEPRLGGLVFRLALPVLVEQSLLYLVGVSDTLLTGRYFGRDHLAAVTVAGYLLWVVGALMSMVSVGATALVARMVGAGDRDGATRVCQQAMGLAIGLGVAVAVVGIATAPAVIAAVNLRGEAATQATVFLRIILLASPMLACTAAGVACLRGAGDTRTGMWVMVLVNAINVALSWSLIHGFGPLPAWGFAGIATGTAVGEAVGGLVILAILARGRSGLHLDRRGMIPVAAEVRRIARISLPALGESITNVGCQLWFLGRINALGATATAAHGVAIRCEAIAFLTIAAFSVAASTLTGQYLGARRPDLAARAARVAWAQGVAVLGALGLILAFEGPAMFAVFLGGRQPEVAELGIPVLRIVAFAMPGLATISVLNGALRGAGDTRWPWLIVLVGYFVVRMPLTYHLTGSPEAGGLGLGLSGAWYAMLVDLTIRGILVAARFLQGGWRATRV